MHVTGEYVDSESLHAADAKVRLTGDLIKFALVTGFLLVLFRPLAIVVGFLLALRLYRRYYRELVAPELRDHWAQREMRRRRSERPHRRAGHCRRGRGDARPEPAEQLIRNFGEDPSAENVHRARAALSEMEGEPVHGACGGRVDARREDVDAVELARVSMADVVCDVTEALRARADGSGIDLQLETDRRGEMLGDGRQLRRAVFDLLRDAIASLEASAVEDPRLVVQMGENLAGDEVWLRVRDNGDRVVPEAERRFHRRGGSSRLIAAHGGQVERRTGHEGDTWRNEYVLRFSKPQGEVA